MTAASVTRSTFDLTISPSSMFESVPSYISDIFAISSAEYCSSRPERTRFGEWGGFLVGPSGAASTSSFASASIGFRFGDMGLGFEVRATLPQPGHHADYTGH